MKPYLLILEVTTLLICARPDIGVAGGGRVISVSVTNSQIRLLVDSTSGYSYQVESSPLVGTRFWKDALSPIPANGNLTVALAPMQGQTAFYKVLEFTNSVFWYDWGYYYEVPFLGVWGLGAPQSSYVHLDRAYEWYIDQAETGTYANNNCGPSAVTMAIKWFNPNFNKTAEDARNTYPEQGGWWYTTDIINYLNLCSVPNTTSSFMGTDQLVGLLNQSNLVILCISAAYLTPDYTAEHRVGRFYSYASGHFLVVKGWRMTNGALFFEVYDANNWHAAYADSTPKGRNRHLVAGDVASAIANWWNYLIVVHPPGGGGGQAKSGAWLKPVDPARIVHKWGI